MQLQLVIVAVRESNVSCMAPGLCCENIFYLINIYLVKLQYHSLHAS